MSGSLQPIDDLSNATLDELASMALGHVRSTEASLINALQHWVAAGEVFNIARDRFGPGGKGWGKWCEQLGVSQAAIGEAMRVARYKDQLPPEVFAIWTDARGVKRDPTIGRALEYVRQLPPIRPRGKNNTSDIAALREANRLVNEGMSLRAAAAMTGITHETVARYRDPARFAEKDRKKEERRREQARAKKALAAQRERQERDRLARATGGELDVAYTHVRRALAAISKDTRAPEAERLLLKAEEHIVDAMRLASRAPASDQGGARDV